MSSSDIPESDIIDAAFSLSSDDDSESELSGSPLSDSPCGLKRYDFTMFVRLATLLPQVTTRFFNFRI